MNENKLYKIGITHGDLNGISYEVIIKALGDNRIMDCCTPIIYGTSRIIQYYKKLIDRMDFSFQIIKNADNYITKRVNVINIVDKELLIEPGNSSQYAGKMAELSLYYAYNDLKTQKIEAIVTAPINKSNMPHDTFKYKGHTDYLAAKFETNDYMMIMIYDALKIGFVTGHLPLSTVSANITEELVYNKIRILNHSLLHDFLLTNPKIAVLSLNPHSGDHGLIGEDEEKTIIPAIRKAWAEKINAFGPFPADGFFASQEYKKYDAILAMYHDQGMLPFKLLSGGEGVNYTAGLPIVRTSPAHGTAYDIAGKNIADEQSFRNAIYWAVDILKNRKS